LASLENHPYPLFGAAQYGLDFAQSRPAMEVMMDPNPDYDISDEAEYFFNFIPWGLRGVYPPPAYPPV